MEALPEEERHHVVENGIWGFTGPAAEAPVSLAACADVIQELGVSLDKAPASSKQNFAPAGERVRKFVCGRWPEGVWETAWFVNPQVHHSIV